MIGLLYLALITGAELLTVFFDVQIGMVGHSMVLAALLFHSSLTAEQRVHRLLLALSLAPLIRILSLASPLVPFPPAYWYLVIGIPLLTATFIVIRNLNLRPRELGLTKGVIPFQLLVAATGIPFGILEYWILSRLEGYEPLIERLSVGEIWFPALMLLIGTGFAEELIFRGVLQRVSGVVFGGDGAWSTSACSLRCFTWAIFR